MFRLLSENLTLKLISLAFAIVLWFFVMGERRHEVSHIVPVTYKGVPEGLIIANQVPGSAEVAISGPAPCCRIWRSATWRSSSTWPALRPG